MRWLSRLVQICLVASCMTGCGSCVDQPDPPPAPPPAAKSGVSTPFLSTHRPRLMHFGQGVAGEDGGMSTTGATPGDNE